LNGLSCLSYGASHANGANGSKIYNNKIYGNPNGIFCSGNDSNEPVIINNSIINNTKTGIFYENIDPYFHGFLIVNNILAYNKAGLSNSCDSSLTLKNNCIWANEIDNYGKFKLENNILQNPQIVDLSKDDFHLQKTSPCIDTGNNGIVTFTIDFDGKVRIWNATGKDSAIVDMGAYEYSAPPLLDQTISLTTGWNIFSPNVLPANADLKAVFQTLITAGSLVKVQDETGNSLEDFGVFGGWKNNIGNLSLTEGYKVKVSKDYQLSLSGATAVFPYKIPLKAGWNIIGYPGQAEAEAKAVVQQ
jgi:hypothetical protein